jgi:hypothetical protein
MPGIGNKKMVTLWTVFVVNDQPRTQALCVVLWLAWPLRGPRGSIAGK